MPTLTIPEIARVLRRFDQAGYELFPLAKGAKTPRDTGWQTNEYTLLGDVAPWVQRGGNVGVRLRDNDLVLDLDPRNFRPGDDPFDRLCADVGENLSVHPTVLTGRGDGGRHIYLSKPSETRTVSKLDDYQGIDFRSRGSFVVAPGSSHPETGRPYLLDDLTLAISDVRAAPDALMALLARPDTPFHVDAAGKLSNEQLAEFLAVLDPHDYGPGQHDRWFALMAASHDATAGHGLPEWLAWCARDERYGHVDDELTARRWESLQAGKRGGANFRTLFAAVVEAGRPDLVAAFDDDDLVDRYDFEAERDAMLAILDEESSNA
ncbi:bifunctional DNA primase/polymerase [Mesorhizobium australicum]|uniref:Primase C terminal 2 (PriCT-2) n=1 Tax=Mesorhizobium australicum TaxID=536018 RepID=A0A1X7NZ11_9HYPH|nr:bifunctional DNA primase/polymerase [Mesorhizobium australicum]SMH43476.1 Primase C terminal 2 (PriCT-2) [Mesorhizobium australicum]